jgi:uncharacterized protein YgiM (DUF1202 family)
VTEPSDQSRPEVVDVREGPSPGTIIRMVVPWLVLAVLMLVIMNFFAQYQTAQKTAQRAATADAARVDPGPAAPSGPTTSAAADKTPAAPKATTVLVIMDGVNFRQSASNGSTIIEALKQGATLTWLATEGNWYKARDIKGRTGFISANPTLTQKR